MILAGIASVNAAGSYSVSSTSGRRGKCGATVAGHFRAGDRCPHCNVQWGGEKWR